MDIGIQSKFFFITNDLIVIRNEIKTLPPSSYRLALTYFVL